MATASLLELSNQIADVVAAAAPSLVQVHGRRRPASGLVYGPDVVVASAGALGREDGLRVRRHDGAVLDAELAGWDPASGLAVLRVPGLGAAAVVPAETAPRVGHMAIAVGRSWSNAVTASTGIVAVIGGPLRTGRGQSIAEVIRITAPMHDGFAGGGVLDATGRLMGIATSAAIRGLGVVIPAGIVWATAATVLEHGSPRRGYLGVAGQQVALSDRQREAAGSEHAVLVVGVSKDSPAAAAGVMVGDALVDVDGRAVASPDDLLDLLGGDGIGKAMTLRVLRGGELVPLTVVVGARPAR